MMVEDLFKDNKEVRKLLDENVEAFMKACKLHKVRANQDVMEQAIALGLASGINYATRQLQGAIELALKKQGEELNGRWN